MKKGIIIDYLDKIVKNIYNKSDVILISSKFFKNSIREKCKNKDKRIEYFPNWAEDIFENPSLKELDIDLPIGFNIMFAGNIGDSQGLEVVIEAAIKTKNEGVNWVFVGDGRKVDWMKKEINSKKITNIYLLGRHPLELMPQFFKKADAMLVTLKNEPIFALTVPAKIQAYMASGKIILGSLNGEGNELINISECGYAVPAGDGSQLALKSMKLSKLSIENKNKMSKNSKEFYRNNFLKVKLFDNLENIINEYSNLK